MITQELATIMRESFEEDITEKISSKEWYIKCESTDKDTIACFLTNIIYLYGKLCKYEIIHEFPLINIAYAVIILGHLPFDIADIDGKEKLLVY